MFAERNRMTEADLQRWIKRRLGCDPEAELTQADVLYLSAEAFLAMDSVYQRLSDFFLDKESRLLTVKEAVAFLKLSRATLYRLMKSGALRSKKIHGRRFIFRVSAEEEAGLPYEYQARLWDGHRPPSKAEEEVAEAEDAARVQQEEREHALRTLLTRHEKQEHKDSP
ncbi:MAG: helix-turn-helix domain-containing protein [Planctomycetes bacterium]|nr:helix-turn-helix domain-containing protein [Planctomycetota bacterium]